MTYRIIYSLIFDVAPGPGGTIRQLVVPLSRDGTATTIELLPPKTRAIDLRVGDQFVFEGKQETVVGIRAYRDGVTDVVPPTHAHGGPLRHPLVDVLNAFRHQRNRHSPQAVVDQEGMFRAQRLSASTESAPTCNHSACR